VKIALTIESIVDADAPWMVKVRSKQLLMTRQVRSVDAIDFLFKWRILTTVHDVLYATKCVTPVKNL
jgi:hypothetical protein